MRRVIVFAIILSLMSNAFAQETGKLFLLDITIHRDNTVELMKFSFGSGKVTNFIDQPSDYRIRVVSVDGSILFDKPLLISFTAQALPYEGQDHYDVELDKVDKFLRLPFYPEADTVELLYKDSSIFSLDVKPYFCDNNGVCSGYETVDNCPKDCGKKGSKLYYVAGIIGGLVMIALAVLIIRKRSVNEYAASEPVYY